MCSRPRVMTCITIYSLEKEPATVPESKRIWRSGNRSVVLSLAAKRRQTVAPGVSRRVCVGASSEAPQGRKKRGLSRAAFVPSGLKKQEGTRPPARAGGYFLSPLRG